MKHKYVKLSSKVSSTPSRLYWSRLETNLKTRQRYLVVENVNMENTLKHSEKSQQLIIV